VEKTGTYLHCFLIPPCALAHIDHVDMAAPSVFQFFIGLSIQDMFTALTTLLVDIHPDASSTAQAASNLVRAKLAAVDLAILDPVI
jgi:hypothetical protein